MYLIPCQIKRVMYYQGLPNSDTLSKPTHDSAHTSTHLRCPMCLGTASEMVAGIYSRPCRRGGSLWLGGQRICHFLGGSIEL